MTGVTNLLAKWRGGPSLQVLNYHRVGDSKLTPYDSGTFSCSTAELDSQVKWLKKHYKILSLQECVAVIHGETELKVNSMLLTFDDGYRDNFEEAFKVLHANKVSGTFFLPTAFVGTGRMPWWDTIAYIVKNSKRDQITLQYPEKMTFKIAEPERSRSIRRILTQYKRPETVDSEVFLQGLEEACAFGRPDDDAERCFMTWDEAREMQAAGMCFGGHSHTHHIMGKLPYELQVEELQVSREILERELGTEVDSFAYPVGHRDSFTEVTFEALRKTKYRTAFSFYSGMNHPGKIDPFSVLRAGVTEEPLSLFQLRVALRMATGREI